MEAENVEDKTCFLFHTQAGFTMCPFNVRGGFMVAGCVLANIV